MKRDFNPVNSLKKNSSTQKLIEKHHESLNKIHQLHREAQEKIGQKERLAQYTVPSTETETINNNYAIMHDEISHMVSGLETKVRKDEGKFMMEFTERLRILHTRYRELEKINIELSSMTKLAADIDTMMKERDALNDKCSSIDRDIRKK